MRLNFEEICRKEVVNIPDGTSFGYADDVEIETETRKTTAIIVKGRRKLFGFLGREKDIYIPWDEIENIGKDIILVKITHKREICGEKENIFQKILNIFFS